MTAGVVRIGDTVRRPVSGDRTVQRALLEHLARKRFEGAPRFLGVDSQGREILSLLPGEVPSELGHYGDDSLAAAAGLLRRLHDATADFLLVRESSAEAMCHNDWGPCNTVFEAGVPYGIIDFDTVAPGERLSDLGCSAWLWLDIGNEDYSGGEQLRRLGVFAAAYDPGFAVARLVPFVLARQTALAASAAARGETALAEWAAACAAWSVAKLRP